MVLLHGTYVRTMYRNERNGFTRFSMLPEERTVPLNKYGNVSCAGLTIPFVEGTPILIEGEYVEKGDYSYVDCTVIREDFSNSKTSVQYLSSGVFDGIGPTTAQSIVRVFGSDMSAFAKRPDAIAVLCSSVKGMNYEKASALMEKLKSTTMQRELFEFVAKFGGTYNDSCKIFEQYGIQSITTLKKKPYEAISKCKLKFAIADSIAKQEGGSACSLERLSALAETLRDECCENGDTYIYQQEMFAYMNKFLVSEQSAFQRPLPTTILQMGLANNKKFYIDTESVPARIYPRSLMHAEDTIVKEMQRLERTSKRMAYSSSLVDEVEAETGMRYAPPQRASFDALKRTGVKVVTGGPGTGKSATSSAMKFTKLLHLKMVNC